jgi:hypothetical protein
MKHRIITLLAVVILVLFLFLLFTQCQSRKEPNTAKSKTCQPVTKIDSTPGASTQPTGTAHQQNSTVTDTLSDSLIAALEAKDSLPPFLTDTILPPDSSGYGAFCDSVKKLIGAVPSFEMVDSTAISVLNLKYRYELEHRQSSENALENQQTVQDNQPNRLDSVNLAFREYKAYMMILVYKRLLSFGVAPHDTIMPKIILNEPITNVLSRKVLPKVERSNYLVNGRFFFLGAGPFLTRDNELSSDSNGKPEIHFSCGSNSILGYPWDVVRHLKNMRINLTFGPPIPSYAGIPNSVNDIGSFIYTFVDVVPVFFLTEGGIVSARLLSIKRNLVEQDFGCPGSFTHVVFACGVQPRGEILGIYIPYDFSPPPSCVVKRTHTIWTVDLNDDGIPEFAGISDHFSGLTGDILNHLLWYANIFDGYFTINPEWKLIGEASDPDCT